jgi:hypothetical protein
MTTAPDIDQCIFEHLRTWATNFPDLSIDDISWNEVDSPDVITSIYNSTNADIPSFVFTTYHNAYNDVVKTEAKCI